MLNVLENRPACVAREISKMHEEFIRGNLQELVKNISSRKVKGEIVVVVAGVSFVDKKVPEINDQVE